MATLDGLAADNPRIDPRTVVGYLDHHPLRVAPCRDAQRAGFLFAGLDASFRRLDAVVHGVSDQVSQRVGQQFAQAFIDFDIETVANDLDFLGHLSREASSHPRRLAEGFADRDLADLEHAVLQQVGQFGEARVHGGKLADEFPVGVGGFQLLLKEAEAFGADQQIPHVPHELVHLPLGYAEALAHRHRVALFVREAVFVVVFAHLA